MTNEEIKNMHWQLNSDNSIYNAINDWSYHRFVCIMKDNSMRLFSGINDETAEGEINTYLDSIDYTYEWELEDIILWIEVPDVK